jgi:2-dehydro-3-deoxygalactonokinase
VRPYLAVDWGTSNVRAWRIGASGAPETSGEWPLGVGRLSPGEAPAVFENIIRPTLDGADIPALLCGMIGSTLGWREAPYRTCPATADDLLDALIRVTSDVAIVPGLRATGVTSAPEVMRGEETQLIGWRALHPEAEPAIICLPGTHSKWAQMQGAQIARFQTAMTGELYELLATKSILRANTTEEDGDAFLAGVEAAGDGGALSTRLFSARTRIVAAGADPRGAASYLSGLLIGAEIAAMIQSFAHTGAPIALVGAPSLTNRYSRALKHRGFASVEEDGARAVISGLSALVMRGAFDGSG